MFANRLHNLYQKSFNYNPEDLHDSLTLTYDSLEQCLLKLDILQENLRQSKTPNRFTLRLVDHIG